MFILIGLDEEELRRTPVVSYVPIGMVRRHIVGEQEVKCGDVV